MKSLLSVLCVVFSAHYVNSQVSLVESSPGIVKPAQALDVTCTVTGFSITDNSKVYSMDWVRQAPGKGLQWMGRIIYNGNVELAESLKGQITITRDTSQGKVYLKLSSVNADDTGRYYCAPYIVSGYFDVWGQGTMVTVTAAVKLPPQVYPLIPQGLGGNQDVTMACLVTKYFPSPVKVQWSTSNAVIVPGELNIRFPLSGDPPTYSSVSQITVTNSEWNNNNYTCTIKFFDSTIEEDIPKSCSYPDLNVQIVQGTCNSNINSQVEMSCQAFNLASENVNIKWFLDEQERPLTQDVQSMGKSDKNFYGVRSKVNIFRGEWNNGARVKCLVTDPRTGKSAEAVARKCSEKTNCLGIDVTMVPPTIEDLYVLEEARIACVASNIKQLSEYSFMFNYPGAPTRKNVQIEDAQLDESGLYSITAILTVSPQIWLSHTEFTCIFKIKELPDSIIRTIYKPTATKLLPPNLSVFAPSAEDLAKNEDCLIVCVAKGFYPDEIYMGWAEDGITVTKEQHINSKPKQSYGNGSFTASSILSVPCEHWNEGKQYSCVVGHEGNAMKFVRSTIDKNSGKPATINVSVNLSDTVLSCM